MDLTFVPDTSSPELVILGSVIQLGKWQHIVINVLPIAMEPFYKVRTIIIVFITLLHIE